MTEQNSNEALRALQRFSPSISDYPNGHPEDAEPVMVATSDGEWIKRADALAALAAMGREAVGEIVEQPEYFNHEGWRRVLSVKWSNGTPPLGTKLYTTPPTEAPRAEGVETLEAWSQRMASLETGQYVGAGAHGIPDEPAAPDPVQQGGRGAVALGWITPEGLDSLERGHDGAHVSPARYRSERQTVPLYAAPPPVRSGEDVR